MMKQLLNFVMLFLVSIGISGCRDNDQHASGPTTSVEKQFRALYKEWKSQSESVKHYSYYEAYVELPAFGSIVALGPDVLPLLNQKLHEDPEDMILAYAVAEIKGWKPEEFEFSTYEEFRDQILARMEKEK